MANIPRLPFLLGGSYNPVFPYVACSATEYHQQVVEQLVGALKFDRYIPAAIPLGLLIAQCITLLPEEIWTQQWTLVPISLGKKRRRERGFNQSEEIAKVCRQYTHLPIADVLIRTRETIAQSTISGEENRRRNVTDCFALNAKPPRRVFLVDDVMTSGSTFLSAGKALRQGGTRHIIAISAARGKKDV